MKQVILERDEETEPAAGRKPADAGAAGAEQPAAPAGKRTSTKPRRDIFDLAWHLLTSVRFAFMLITILAVASLAGTLIIQAPAEIAADRADYAQWLERLRPTWGVFTDVMSALGIFNIFGSIWFQATIGVLALSIVVCTLNRWPAVRRNLFTPRVRLAPGFFRAVPFRAEIPAGSSGLQAADAALSAALARRGYRVLRQTDETAVHVFADRHRFSQLGTFALHAGMVLFLVGALWGSITGSRERSFMVPEGSTRAVGMGTDLFVKVESFADEYYTDGPPKDYRSELVLYKGQQEVRRQTIRVNDPLEYEGWRFHQGFFGPAAIMEVRDSVGRFMYNDGVAMGWRTTGERAMGSFRIPEQNLKVFLVGPGSGGVDPMIPAGELRLEVYRGADSRPLEMVNIQQGKPRTVAGLNFLFVRERQFSGLQIVNNPARSLVYVTWIMMGFGLVLAFYFPYRQLWARCQQEADGTVRVMLGATGRRELGLTQEFLAVEQEVRDQVNGAQRRASNV